MIIFKNRLSTGWFCLPSELVIYLPQTFKYKRNIKNQEQSLRTLYTIQKPAPTIEPRPAKTSPNSRSVPDNLAARTYPEKVKSQAQALNIMRFQNLCPSCHMNNSLLHRHKITSISQILGWRGHPSTITEYDCTVYSCGPGEQLTSRLRPVYQISAD